MQPIPQVEKDSPHSLQKKQGLMPVYWWALSYVKPYRWILVSLIVVIAALSGAELIIPKFIQYFIDTIIPTANTKAFLWFIAAAPVFLGVVIAGKSLQNLLQRQLQEKSSRDMQHAIFRKLRVLGFAYYEQHPVGETLSFLNSEVTALQKLYRGLLPWLLNGVIFSTMSVIFMITSSAELSLILIPSFLLYYIFGPMLEKRATLSSLELADKRVRENQKAYESVSALAELRAYGAEEWDTKRYLDKVDDHNRSEVKTVWYLYIRGSNRRMSYYIGAIAVFIYGYYLITNDRLLVGEFVAFILYYFAAMQSITAVVTNITEQRILMQQAKRLYDFIQLTPQVSEPDPAIHIEKVTGTIEFQNVHYAYNQGTPVIRGFNLTIEQGKRVAMVGTSGSGKSTVLKLAGRFYDPDEGQILLDGVPMDQLSFDTVRNSFGFVFQETYLFGTSVKDNIRFGDPDASDEDIQNAAIAACAHDFIMELPEGYDTHVGERGIKLSGGQKQRIGIARMFVKKPSVILLDEATSALDNISESVVQEALGRLLQGRTTLAIAHRISTIQDYDLIVVMEEGKAVEMGTYEELMSKKEHLYRLVEGPKAKEEVPNE